MCMSVFFYHKRIFSKTSACDILGNVWKCPLWLVSWWILWLFSTRAQLLQWCPTLCNPTDCSPPGPSVHGIFPAKILEWVAISSSRGSPQPRDWTLISCVSCTAGGFFTTEPMGKHPSLLCVKKFQSMDCQWKRQGPLPLFILCCGRCWSSHIPMVSWDRSHR